MTDRTIIPQRIDKEMARGFGHERPTPVIGVCPAGFMAGTAGGCRYHTVIHGPCSETIGRCAAVAT